MLGDSSFATQHGGETGASYVLYLPKLGRRRSSIRLHRDVGIVIVMYFDDHPPPHFHAKYGEHQAQIVIATGEVLHGGLPRRALRLVAEWTALRRDELLDDWERAERAEPLVTIDPLP